jgi:hypothetical protein
MVTIQVNNLIDFVAEAFADSESSPEEFRRIATHLMTANLTGHDSHGYPTIAGPRSSISPARSASAKPAFRGGELEDCNLKSVLTITKGNAINDYK